jgi:hypothetical protein
VDEEVGEIGLTPASSGRALTEEGVFDETREELAQGRGRSGLCGE